MQKKKNKAKCPTLISQGGAFFIAAAGVILFADLTGNLQTDPANQT